MPRLTITPNDDGTEVTLRLDGTGTTNAQELEGVIEALLLARSRMAPAVPIDPPIGQDVAAIYDPRYWTNHDAATGNTLLIFQHPGFGWLPFLLPPGERDRLASILRQQAEMYPTVPSAAAGGNIH